MTDTPNASSLQEEFHLPHGYTVAFTWNKYAGLRVEWQPGLPYIQKLNRRRKFQRAYFTARDSFMRSLATLTGATVAVVDLNRHDAPDGDFGELGGLTVIRPAVKH